MNARARVTAVPALLAAGAFASLPGFLTTAVAQHTHGEATPESASALAELGLPELTLTVTGDAVEGVPASIEAGRYLLTVEGEPATEGPPPGAMILQLPEGMTLDEAGAQAQASPDGPPPFYFEAVLAGGASVSANGPGVSVIDLPPGEWIAAGTYFSRPPVVFDVTGELPADLPEPDSTATFTLQEMTIEITEGAPVAGENLLRIENRGEQPHFIEIVKVPDGTTEEDAEAWLEADMSGTPVADLEFEYVATTPDQSGGVTQWVTVTLQAGTYEALCFVPDPDSGMPHAFMGMHRLFTVGA
jgi:hypothetical protein